MLSIFKKLFKKEPVKNEYPLKVSISEAEIDAIVKHEWINKSLNNLYNFNSDLHYWQSVVKAIIKAESNFNIYSVYWEKTLGNKGYDKQTKRKYLSEGLMQLSYSDARYYSCNFNWELDKNLPDQDKNKTIFNPQNNIACGLTILNKLVGMHGHYIFDKYNYWAVLKPSNKRHKVFLEAFNKYYEEGHFPW